MFNIDLLLRKSYFLVCMLLPFSTSIEMGAVVNFGFLLNVFCFPLILLKLISTNYRCITSKLDSCILVTVILLQLWIFVSLIWSVNFSASLLRASYFFFSAFILHLYLITESKQEYINNILKSTNIFAVFLSLYFLINFSFSVYEIGFAKTFVQRFVGGAMALPWGASNIISVVLICSLVTLSLGEVFSKIKVRTITLILISSAILLTLSRTGSGILVFLIVLLILSRLSVVRAFFVSFVALLVIPSTLIFLLYFLSSFDFFSNRYSTSNFSSLNGRGEIWAYYLNKISNDLFSVNGFYGSLANNTYSPHNIFISFYYDTGFIGFLLLITLILLLTIKISNLALKVNFLTTPFIFLSILFFPLLMLLNLNFEDGIYVPATWYMFFSVVVLFIHKGKENHNNRPRAIES